MASVSFLSDYGLTDEFVGVCHGVMLAIAPAARIIDVTHGIRRGDVAQGARVLAHSVPYLPPGAHLAVVDPGVGTARWGLVVTTYAGSHLVGPDNGLLLPAAERLGGVAGAHRLENPQLQAAAPSATFHGRDIFAPAAAHLVLGVPAGEFGPPVGDLVACPQPVAVPAGAGWRGEVVGVDHYGNLETNLPVSLLAGGGFLDIEVAGGPPVRVPIGDTFASVGEGQAVVLADSHGSLALCVNGARAAERFGAGVGAEVAAVSAP